MTKHRYRYRTTVVCAALSALSLLAVPATSAAATAPASSAERTAPASAHPADGIRAKAVAGIEDRTARTLAASLGRPAWRTEVRHAALASPAVTLGSLANRPGSPAADGLRSAIADADRDLARAKGLRAGTGSLLQLRLGDSSMRRALGAGAEPLVAAAPSDDDTTAVTAYDSRGRTHLLDMRKVPDRPVYVIDLDGDKAVAAGMAVLREQFAAHGLTGPAAAPAAASANGFWTSRISSVRLSDDEEPWVKGDAEIYSLVTGFGLDGKVRVDPVDMPYLDEDGKTYSPNQILVNWSSYKYNLADVVMMEEDGSTNYRALATAIAGVLLTIADLGAYIPLVNAVLDAMPDDWWTDDPDYVDSWYTLAQSLSGSSGGARGNGSMTLEPYWVSGF
ncbi:DUF3103 family protein [Streptomyces sp. NPDC058685]|uniref:DUF3103 family protein n=1 Tax=Streptomyces sp. NPDC058685 TaxID=3346598 RepID=UPI0036609974